LEIIDQLKNELIKEKQNSEKQAEEIRRELNGAYDKMIVDIDQRWGERLQVIFQDVVFQCKVEFRSNQFVVT